MDSYDRLEHAIVFDNCALNRIIDCDVSGNTAQRIGLAVAEGRVAVWTCPSLMLETVAGSAKDPVTARRKLAFLRALCGGRLLKSTGNLLEWEGRNGRYPSGADRFMPREDEEAFYEQSLAACDGGGKLLDPEDGSQRELRQLIYEEKEDGRLAWLDATDAAREAVTRAFEAAKDTRDADPAEAQGLTGSDGSVNFVALGGWMLAMPRDVFAGWVSKMLEQVGFKRSVTAQDLSLFPYATSATGFVLAKIARNYMTGQKWPRNDTYDARYCVAASESRALVTSDVDLQATCARMPYRPFGIADVGDIGPLLAGQPVNVSSCRHDGL